MSTLFRIVAYEHGERRAVLRTVNLERSGRRLDDDPEVGIYGTRLSLSGVHVAKAGDDPFAGLLFRTRGQADGVIDMCKRMKPSIDLRSEEFTPDTGIVVPKEVT